MGFADAVNKRNCVYLLLATIDRFKICNIEKIEYGKVNNAVRPPAYWCAATFKLNEDKFLKNIIAFECEE
jgi:hypothetical protein